MRTTQSWLIGLSAGLLVWTGISAADPAPAEPPAGKPAEEQKANKKARKANRPEPGRLFDKFDADGDGKVALGDIPEKVRQRVARLDKDGDGLLTRQELRLAAPGGDPAAPAVDLAKIFAKRDANNDGKIADDEIPDRLRPMIERVDKNGDGAIQKQEWMEARRGRQGNAGPPGRALAVRLMSLDTDGDGKVALADVPEKIRPFVEKGDADKDGQISKEEASTLPALPADAGAGAKPKLDPTAILKRADANNDGKLSRDELGKRAAKFPFDRVDGDKDGMLTAEELRHFGERIRKAPQNGGGKKRDGGQELSARRLFNQQDIDADGRVTKEESKGDFSKRFDALDVNKDGKLELSEVEKPQKPEDAK